MVQEATDICLRVLKESNKSRFDSFSRYEQCIDHIPYYLSGLSRAHFFRQPFSKQLYILHTVLIQVYNWEIRHHSLVCCCGLFDILYISVRRPPGTLITTGYRLPIATNTLLTNVKLSFSKILI